MHPAAAADAQNARVHLAILANAALHAALCRCRSVSLMRRKENWHAAAARVSSKGAGEQQGGSRRRQCLLAACADTVRGTWSHSFSPRPSLQASPRARHTAACTNRDPRRRAQLRRQPTPPPPGSEVELGGRPAHPKNPTHSLNCLRRRTPQELNAPPQLKKRCTAYVAQHPSSSVFVHAQQLTAHTSVVEYHLF